MGACLVPVVRRRDGGTAEVEDWVSDEVPIALEFNGISHAVMLATPSDMEDFALGFALCEGIVESAADLYECEVHRSDRGVTVSMQVSARCFAALKTRRRSLAGRTGCGVCGVESLAQVFRPVPAITSKTSVRPDAIARAMRAMRERQTLNQITGSMHAAAWCNADGSVRLLREDVGRHNALDKLIGAMAHAGDVDGQTSEGFIAVTSRASIEMVQKAAVAGAPLLAAVSAPTRLAIDTARAAGISLVGLVRGDDLVVYAHADRVDFGDRGSDRQRGLMAATEIKADRIAQRETVC